MVLAVKVKKKETEKVKEFLVKNNLLNNSYLIGKEGKHIFLPVKEKNSKLKKYQVVEKRLKKIKKNKTIAEMLKNKLSSEELNLLPRTFEEIGDILIIELAEELKKKKKMIGQFFLKKHKQAATVLMKKEEHKGRYRLRKLEWLAGEKKKETIHRENGVLLKLDVEKVYFSSKLGGERMRIAELVKPDEEVLVMFSGCGPYPLTIARNSPVKEAVGVELNPVAHGYAVDNMTLNRLWGKVKFYRGDVRKVVPKLGRKFERVVMPLPKTGEEFLDLALNMVKKKGIVHYYAFLGEENMEKEIEKIKKICKKNKRKSQVVNWRKCGSFAPGVFRVVYDLKIE